MLGARVKRLQASLVGPMCCAADKRCKFIITTLPSSALITPSKLGMNKAMILKRTGHLIPVTQCTFGLDSWIGAMEAKLRRCRVRGIGTGESVYVQLREDYSFSRAM